MPKSLDIKKKLSARSERVKSCDIHPTESWALAALYSGKVFLWDYETEALAKSFEISDLPVRCAKFIVREGWFVCASDDMKLRVFNYSTSEKVKEWEAHTDYIRTVEVHPTLPYVLSSSDDMSVKLWDWEKGFQNTQEFVGHAHYVMAVKFNPKDTNTFATASLDRSIKVWGLSSPTPHYSLEGHERGVNCVDYYPSGDKPYLLSGADDKTVKIWDYQTKTVVQSLDGHTHNVCSVMFHPKLPLIISASEDGTVRIWQSSTYRQESTLNYGMERAWALAATKESNKIAIGYDEGLVVVEFGNDDPIASMDGTGKVVFAKNNDIQTGTVKGVVTDESVEGEKLQIAVRDLGSTEIYPTSLSHNCNGRFIAVCGDGEFIIYTSQALRNKAFGSALDFVWSGRNTGDYAIRESISRIKIFSNFKEHKIVKPATASAEQLYGGHLLGVKGSDDAVLFYDWEGEFVRKIDVSPNAVYWSDSGEMCLIATDDAAYVLQHDVAGTAQALAMGKGDAEEGVDGSFELLFEINEKVTSGKWVGDCFLFTNSQGRLNYSVAGQIQTLVHLETSSGGATVHSILGYLAKEDRVYLVDKSMNITSYKIMLAMLQYQTAVVRGDFDAANELLPMIPESEYLVVARFLESQGFKEEALSVTTDVDHKFDLALELGQLELGLELMGNIPADESETTESQAKWKRLSDLALSQSKLELAESAALACKDFSGLLLLYSSTANKEGLANLAELANEGKKYNIAFICFFLLGKVEECINLLSSTNRLPEAAFFARTYHPSKVEDILSLWKTELSKTSTSAANALSTPDLNPDMFPDFDVALKVEQMFLSNRNMEVPAGKYLEAKGDLEMDLISLIKASGASNGSSNGNGTQQVVEEVVVPEPKVEEAAPAPVSPAVDEEKLAAEKLRGEAGGGEAGGGEAGGREAGCREAGRLEKGGRGPHRRRKEGRGRQNRRRKGSCRGRSAREEISRGKRGRRTRRRIRGRLVKVYAFVILVCVVLRGKN